MLYRENQVTQLMILRWLTQFDSVTLLTQLVLLNEGILGPRVQSNCKYDTGMKIKS